MDVKHRCVPCSQDRGVVDDHDLCSELFDHHRRVVDMSKNISACYVFLVNASKVKSDVVAWLGSLQLLVVHFNGLDLSDNPPAFTCWAYDDLVSDLHDAGFNLSYRNDADSLDVVHIL